VRLGVSYHRMRRSRPTLCALQLACCMLHCRLGPCVSVCHFAGTASAPWLTGAAWRVAVCHGHFPLPHGVLRHERIAVTPLLPRPRLGTPEAAPTEPFAPGAFAAVVGHRTAHTGGRARLGAPLALASILAASPPADPPVA
jgi:hypothetical protein